MGRYNKATGDELYSTEEAAKAAGISYVTLRRWLAGGDFQEWLAKERKPPLTSLELSNGNRVWQFGNRNRVALIEYRDLPERRRRVPSVLKQIRQGKPAPVRRITATEQAVRNAVKQYEQAIGALRAVGMCPRNPILVQRG